MVGGGFGQLDSLGAKTMTGFKIVESEADAEQMEGKVVAGEVEWHGQGGGRGALCHKERWG